MHAGAGEHVGDAEGDDAAALPRGARFLLDVQGTFSIFTCTFTFAPIFVFVFVFVFPFTFAFAFAFAFGAVLLSAANGAERDRRWCLARPDAMLEDGAVLPPPLFPSEAWCDAGNCL